jgi:hypothetical protein
MNLLSWRSFSTELIKIAVELQDSDIRKLMAERNGQEYLEGGRLGSNGAGEGGDIGYVPEIQKKAARLGMTALDPMATKLDKTRSQVKDPSQYQGVRDTAMTGLGGGLMGGSVLRAAQYMRKGQANFRPGAYAAAAGIGAAAGLSDRIYRHRHELSFGKGSDQEKQANLNSATFSPGRELDRGHKVGSFQDKRIHMSRPEPTAGLVGNKGRLPK